MKKTYGIHNRLRQAREEQYKSAYQFANEHGIPTGTYGSHENGTRGISILTAKRYAKLLKVNEMWLLTGEGTMHPEGLNDSEGQNFSHSTYHLQKAKPSRHSLKRESLTSAMVIAQEVLEKHRDQTNIQEVTNLAWLMLEMAEKWQIPEDKINAEMAEWLLTWGDK